MDDDAEIRSMKLCAIPHKTRSLLSCLLDPPKIIPTDGPVKLPRDWEGLASLVNLSSEQAANIKQSSNKTGRVLEVFQQDPSATVGTLLDYLQILDRYDVYDDLLADLRNIVPNRWDPSAKVQKQVIINNNNNPISSDWEDSGLITYDDGIGYKHLYHAYLLHAPEDQEFVDELLDILKDLRICTKDKVRAGYETQYAPIAKLIEERCQRIILVCSPDFLNSPANTFFSNYAQAVSIESGSRKIIPIMYKQCELAGNLRYYHKLHYPSSSGDRERSMYDFWTKLRQSLQTPEPVTFTLGSPQSVNCASSQSMFNDDRIFLPPLPAARSLIDVSRVSEGKPKKTNMFSKMLRPFKHNGKKKKDMVAS